MNFLDSLLGRSKTKKFFSIAFLVVIVVLTVCHAKSRKEKHREINRYLGITEGVITRYERNGTSGRITYYSYEVEDVVFESIANGDQWFSGCITSKWCIGKRYIVECSTKTPDLSRIIWDRPLD